MSMSLFSSSNAAASVKTRSCSIVLPSQPMEMKTLGVQTRSSSEAASSTSPVRELDNSYFLCSLSNKNISTSHVKKFKNHFKKEIEQMPLSPLQAQCLKDCFLKLGVIKQKNYSAIQFAEEVMQVAKYLCARLTYLQMENNQANSISPSRFNLEKIAPGLVLFVEETIIYFFIANIFRHHYKTDVYSGGRVQPLARTMLNVIDLLQKKQGQHHPFLHYSQDLKDAFDKDFNQFRILINGISDEVHSISIDALQYDLQAPRLYNPMVNDLSELNKVIYAVKNCEFNAKHWTAILNFITSIKNDRLHVSRLLSAAHKFYSYLHFLYKTDQVSLEGVRGTENVQRLKAFVKLVAHFAVLLRQYFNNSSLPLLECKTCDTPEITQQMLHAFTLNSGYRGSSLVPHLRERIESLAFPSRELTWSISGINAYTHLTASGDLQDFQELDIFHLTQGFNFSPINQSGVEKSIFYGWQQEGTRVWVGAFVVGKLVLLDKKGLQSTVNFHRKIESPAKLA